ncbi:DNA polymerase IV [Halalkalibacter wakoensis JCM 9140]|uniref:DNA-directed DNA polymerase n=1 Tax=Halalkalibacter wakoensis JCM 9140 TaxID=1236970 RepID=W4PY93_9BACI|nr:DNA polymerase IV [Halalkalibacter wakoensis JCM 9140]
MYKKDPIQLARSMQEDVFTQLKLPCSIGIAPNKFLAKMASDMKKPNGITVLRKRDIAEKLWPLPINEMHGIGRRTVDKWRNLHISTIGDLANAENELLLKKFGERGLELKKRANGEDDRPVNPHAYSEYKSIGHSTTLRADTRNKQIIMSTLQELANRVHKRLRKKDVFARGVQLTIRYFDWKLVTKSRKLESPIQEQEDLFLEAITLLEKGWSGESVRLLGISTYDLIEKKYAYKQLDLFTYKEEIKKDDINEMVQQLKERFGEDIIQKGWKKEETE